MDRLIYKEADGDLTCRSRDFDKVFPTLYAYEETGLTPEQAKALSDNLEALKEVAHDLSDTLKQARTELESVKKEIAGKDLQIQLMAEARNNALAERDALAAELKEEMYRHDRYVDFELDEAEVLRNVKANLEWAIKYLREGGGCAGCKYEDMQETEEPCAHCQRLTLQGDDKWEFHGAEDINVPGKQEG